MRMEFTVLRFLKKKPSFMNLNMKHFKIKLKKLAVDNSDLFHFSLGIFVGLMVMNTANIFANGALTLLSGITYGTIKTISNLV